MCDGVILIFPYQSSVIKQNQNWLRNKWLLKDKFDVFKEKSYPTYWFLLYYYPINNCLEGGIMNCIPPLSNYFNKLSCVDLHKLLAASIQRHTIHPGAVRLMSWKKKKKKRLQFVIWLKNDKHLLEHGTWRKRQSFRGNSVSSANSIIIWYLRRVDLIWCNSGDIRPISSRWGLKHTVIPRPPLGQRTASSSLGSPSACCAAAGLGRRVRRWRASHHGD